MFYLHRLLLQGFKGILYFLNFSPLRQNLTLIPLSVSSGHVLIAVEVVRVDLLERIKSALYEVIGLLSSCYNITSEYFLSLFLVKIIQGRVWLSNFYLFYFDHFLLFSLHQLLDLSELLLVLAQLVLGIA